MLSVMIRHEVLGLLIAGGVDMQDPLIDVSSLQHLTADISYEVYFYILFKMPRPATRKEVLDRLRKTIDDGSIIVGAGAGMYI